MNNTARDDIAKHNRRDERSWHLDKRLNIGHLLTTLVLAATVLTWANAIDKRVIVNTTERENNKELIQISQTYVISTVSTIDDKVSKLDVKVDKVLERLYTHDSGSNSKVRP